MKEGKEMLTPAYELVQEEVLKDSASLGLVLKHKKSGARVCILSNEDDNKVFCVGFRTPPKDSTGVAHIIEHSVLNGSEKFPLKKPFVELIKGSLNTFLNAFTAPDKTMYPVASCNEQDFKNLMDVYMDAVFHPNIYHRQEIFMQEGWHYELDSKEADLKINGVVYNEMKGAFSSPEQQLWREIMHSLYPDNAYGVESGGNPDNIPDLTYEGFLNFHKTYYHPSNSYIYLYGNMDVKERLEWIDKAYLSAYDEISVDSDIPAQKKFHGCVEKEAFYPTGKDADTKNKSYLSYNVMVGSCCDAKLCTAMELLEVVLLSAAGAPLKQALVQAGLAEDVISTFSDDIKQPFFSIIAKNTEPEKKEEFISIIRTTLEKIAKEGLPQRSLQAAINNAEFRYREADYGSMPKGLVLGMMVLNGWMADEKGAFSYLHGNDLLADLKAQIGTGYFEGLIQKYLLEPEHATIFIMKPQCGLTEKKEEALCKKLADYKASLSEEEIQNIIDAQAKLKKYQDTPDSKEIIEKLPLLKHSDLRKEAFPIISNLKMVNGVPVVTQEVFTNGIAYLKLYFDVHDVPAEQIGYLGILSTALGYIDTDHYSFLELDNETKIQTGGIYTMLETFLKKGSDTYYRPEFGFDAKVLYDKLDKVEGLVGEMIFKTHWSDTSRLKEILLELKSKLAMRLNMAGHEAARIRAMSYQSEKFVYDDKTSGIDFYRLVDRLVGNFEEEKDRLADILKNLCSIIFRQENLTVSITAEKEGIEKAQAMISSAVSKLPGQPAQRENVNCRPAEFGFSLEKKQEAFTFPGQVQYVAKGGNYFKTGEPYNGAMSVMNNMLSMDYLWDKVRVHGGAYGCMCNYSNVNGAYTIVSYRDPNLAETFKVYDSAWEFLENFDADDREMTKLIIGTLSNIDMPLTPQKAGARSFNLFMVGATYEQLQKERDELLAATAADIRSFAGLLKKTMEQNCICVVGSEAKVQENKDLFQTVEALF